MALVGAYEDRGSVVIESDDKPPARLSWREARQRLVVLREMEQQVSQGYRSARTQKVLEQLLGAYKEARLKDPKEADWKPPLSLSMFKPGSKIDIQRAVREEESRIAIVNGGKLIIPGR